MAARLKRLARGALALWLAGGLAGCGSSSPAVEMPGLAGAAGSSSGSAGAPSPDLISSPLRPAPPRVVPLASAPDTGTIPLDASLAAWPGAASHLAGTAHYDHGEWIYEDYPWTAYGAAQADLVVLYELLDTLGNAFEPAQRLPGGLGFLIAQTGAGPLADQADLSELRLAVRGSDVYLLARTTTMTAPVQTALLLLFDTGRAGAAYAVPFGSGLSTSSADTAALVTAGGTRIVDLASGNTLASAPAAADATGYINALETRLPLALVGKPDRSSIRLVAASGLAAAGAYELQSGGSAGPIAKVVPRFDEPVESVFDRRQALALAAHDIDHFFTTVSLDRLRAGSSERLLPGIGYNVRTFVAPEALSSEGGTNGILREYGLYLPQGFADAPTPATLLLRGSSMTAHSLAAITPGLFQNLGDDNGAIMVSPCGRSDLDQFRGPVYHDVLQALGDAQALLPIDPERITVAGYSMGGYATYMFAATQPDRFAGAFVIEGPVGGLQPATSLYQFPDVIPLLANLRYEPIEIYQGDIDADVPVTNALAAVQRLDGLGDRFRFNLLPGNTHFTPGILNDYSIGARYLRATQREAAPARVVYARSMPYEQAVDTGSTTDQPNAGKSTGLQFGDAWFVHDLQAADPVNGTATVDVTSLARPAGTVTPLLTTGIDSGPLGGQTASPFEQLAWQPGPGSGAPRNAMQAQLSGTTHVRFDLAGMALTGTRPLAADIGTDTATTVEWTLTGAACVTLASDGAPSPVEYASGSVAVVLAPGQHRISLNPCSP